MKWIIRNKTNNNSKICVGDYIYGKVAGYSVIRRIMFIDGSFHATDEEGYKNASSSTMAGLLNGYDNLRKVVPVEISEDGNMIFEEK